MNKHKGRDGSMERLFIVSVGLVSLVSSAVGLYGATFTGSAAAAGTYIPDPRRYTSYAYTEAGKTLRLTMPEGLMIVRGILVVGRREFA